MKPTGQVERAVQTGAITLTSRDDAHDAIWKVNAKSSQLAMHDDSNVTTALSDVDGEIYEKGKTASTFIADKAYANRASKRLSMQGNVRAQDAEKRYTLSARALDWLPDHEVIQARQGVTIQGDGFTAGPFAVVWTSADLKKFGTPDMIKPGISIAAVLAGLHITSAVQQGVVFKDSVSNMEVRQLSKWLTERLDAKSFHFEGAGNPFIADWKTQALHVEGKTIDGIAEMSGKTYFLKQAKVTGGLTGTLGTAEPLILKASTLTYTADQTGGTAILTGGVTVSQESAKTSMKLTSGSTTLKTKMSGTTTTASRLEASGGAHLNLDRPDEHFKINGSSAVLNLETSDWELTLNGPVTVDRTAESKGAATTVHIEGSKADGSLEAQSGLLKAVQLSGPVTFRAKSVSDSTSTVTGSCSSAFYSITYDGSGHSVSSTLKLTGSIRIKGEGSDGTTASFLGSLEADAMTLYFDAKGEVTKFTADGAPGKATVSGGR